mgnify:FL=1
MYAILFNLTQSWPMPENPLSIVIFGAGSIVRDAHLPAYAASGFKVKGIYDPNLGKAYELAEQHGFAVYESAQQAAD